MILKKFTITCVGFLLAGAYSSAAQSKSSYLVKYKSRALMNESIGSLRTLSRADSSISAEVIFDDWVKITSSSLKSDSEGTILVQKFIQNNQAHISFTQPDYPLGLIESFRLEDPESRAQFVELMKQRPELVAPMAARDNPALVPAPNARPSMDPLLTKQWGMIDIGLMSIFQRAKEHSPITVAVIDSGVDYTHPDLTQNMWRNLGETGLDSAGRDKSTNKIDDDKNGYVDDVVGYDFVDNDSLPYDKSTPKWQLFLGGGNAGHGTHCAGNIAAKGNNGLGISGVAPNAKIMALRFISEKGNGETSSAIKAIKYAVDHGAKVLNNSWGGMGESEDNGADNKALREIIKYAESKGVLFVAAAGNGFRGRGYDNDTARAPVFPASYPYQNIISVAAIDNNDQLGKFSNYGVKTVHIAAPGVKIYSTVVGGSYSDQPIPFLAVWEGTSMAAPHVAGAAALYWSLNPNKSMLEVKDAIIKSAVKLPALSGKTQSGGKLNLVNLIR